MSRPGDGPCVLDVEEVGDIAGALDAGGIPRGRPVLVLVGGAGGMGTAGLEQLDAVLHQAVLPVLSAHSATVVDGGTDAGVMRAIGLARSSADAGFPLVGVVAAGTVLVPGRGPVRDDAAELERHHTHAIVVPGEEWGDEAGWIVDVADAAAGGRPSVTVLVNGGAIAYDDVRRSLDRGRPVLVLAGTGRTADEIAAAAAGNHDRPLATEIAASPLTSVVPLDDVPAVRSAVAGAFAEGARSSS